MKVSLAHGSGGRGTWELINKLIVSKVPGNLRKVLDGIGLDELDDGAAIKVGDRYVVIAIDSHTVKPLKFPGGDLGSLAASGAINDVLMMGARPLAVMDAIIAEEGTDLELLNEIIESFLKVTLSEGVAVIGGDFKVMPKGTIDGVVITTAGIGVADKLIVDRELKAGDKVVVTGEVASHGATIIASQLGLLSKVRGLRSDVRPLTDPMLSLIREFGDVIHAARDPTRGGLAATLNEWASSSGLTVFLDRSKVPVAPPVKVFLEMLGIDPLQVASEGVAVLGISGDAAEEVVEYLRSRGFRRAEVIGEVIKPPKDILKGRVVVKTEVGGLTLLDSTAIQTPRIC